MPSIATEIDKNSSLTSNNRRNAMNRNSVDLSSTLLRIESVAPSTHGKHTNRSIHRSYSTLGTNINYLKGIPVNERHDIVSEQSHVVQNTTENNEMATSTKSKAGTKIPMNRFVNGGQADVITNTDVNSSGSSSCGGGSSSGIIVIGNVHHGFWRIQRTSREREKMPDRINLDRRGLTTLPIIENEPNLRLLSLQHNLINSFCVPLTLLTNDNNQQQAQQSVTRLHQQKERHIGDTSKECRIRKMQRDRNLYNGRRGLQRTHSIQRPPTATSSSFRNIYLCSNETEGGGDNTGNTFTSSSQTNPNSLTAFDKEKFILRRSNSFVSNYLRNLNGPKVHLGRLIQSRANGSMATTNGRRKSIGRIGAASSFSSDSTPEFELRPPDDMVIGCKDPFVEFSDSFQNLVFLDLYDNQIERISTLDGLKCLTVLLLGKNRISDISGIVSLRDTLKVLDLHGNKISTISQRICQLQELKSLNLAGNHLKQIHADDFRGLIQLKELNLKRNRIRKINGFDDLRSLERLWLCHNDLQKIDEMSTVVKAISLKEITVENNPVALGGDCVSFLVSYLPSLSMLSQMHVTEQVRRAAIIWRKTKEQTDANYSHLNGQTMRREEVISNVRTNWELMRSQQPTIPRNSCQFIHQTLNNSSRNNFPTGTTATDAESDVQSVLSENMLVDRKILRQKIQTTKKTARRSVTPVSTARRSMSHDRLTTKKNEHVFESTKIGEAKEIRLPPISIAICDIDSQKENFIDATKKKKPKSDTRESKSNKNMPIDVQRIESSNDETSNISSNSLKPTVTATTPAMPEDRRTTTKCRSATQTQRRNSNNSLHRSQTARSPNIPQTTSTISSTATVTTPSTMSNTVPSQATTAITAAIQSTKAHTKAPIASDREREQGGDYLIEICGRYLNVYGSGAIKFIDRQWNVQKAADVHTVKFNYVNYGNAVVIFSRLKNRFQNIEHFVFRDTNIETIGQLNALADIQGIKSLTIDDEGNPICEKSNEWRFYAIYRLAHWGLKKINDSPITEQDVQNANKQFATLSNLILRILPETTIEPLLMRLHLEDSCTLSKLRPKQWLMQTDDSLRSVVIKEALQWKCTIHNENETIRQKMKKSIKTMIENAFDAVEKLQRIDKIWSKILLSLIKNTIEELSNGENYQLNELRRIQTNINAAVDNTMVEPQNRNKIK